MEEKQRGDIAHNTKLNVFPFSAFQGSKNFSLFWYSLLCVATPGLEIYV